MVITAYPSGYAGYHHSRCLQESKNQHLIYFIAQS